MKIFVLALVVYSVCAVPVSKNDDDAQADALIMDKPTITKTEALKTDMMMDKPITKTEALVSDKSEAEASVVEPKSDELKADKTRERREEEPKAEEIKSSKDEDEAKADELKASKVNAEELKADKSSEKAEELKANEDKSRERREDSPKAEELKSADAMKPSSRPLVADDEPSMEALVANGPMGAGPMGPGPQHTPSPCDVPEFKYYQPHPTDAKRYYQCDPWGTFVEKKCDVEGTIWDRWTLKCQTESKIVNITDIVLPTTTRRVSAGFNCTIDGQRCHHGGICVVESDLYRCSCTVGFVGDFCETHTDDFDLYADIMSGNFSMDSYIKRIVNQNVTVDITYYERFKSILDPVTYGKIIDYMTQYKSGLVRYDTLVSRLVKDVLGDIYPDADFLRTFNISNQNVITTLRLVPNLLSYAKYSSERYQDVFVQYQHVLEQLWSFLNVSVPRLRQEAVHYTDLTRYFANNKISEDSLRVLNHTVARRFGGRNFLNDTLNNITEVAVREILRVDFVTILDRVNTLNSLVHDFSDSVVVEWKKNPNFIFKTVGETGFEKSAEFIKIFREIHHVNCEIWHKLVAYGFWYITNVFTTTPVVVV
jgi:hypothetical protein